MSDLIHPLALFRLSVLGPLASRDKLERGELKSIIKDLANKTYNIPGSKRTQLHPQTIERWHYIWKRNGILALAPKIRSDKNQTQLSEVIQEALLKFKKENPSRSINTLIHILEKQGTVSKGELARSTVHRFLKSEKMSKRTVADAITIERRSFLADHAGDIWYGDVMHGPSISTSIGMRKVYLVSLMDDNSRLITHSAFCFGETALDIEGVLKQAILKRGVPKKFIVDNGAAYVSGSLQGICARLKIKLIYCRPYEPEGKGKLERYHRTFRELFLNEIDIQSIQNIEDLNARLWVWVEQVYHKRPHQGLDNQTPLLTWQKDLLHIQQPESVAQNLDHIFYHRLSRYVRKNGTILWDGKFFEVPYELSGQNIKLVFDPHAKKALWVESDDGKNLGLVTPLDVKTNLHRHRQRPGTIEPTQKHNTNVVELEYEQYCKSIGINNLEDF
jgi:transposase InsO family protein